MLLESEECTKAFGIPTIWLNFLGWVEANKAKLDLSKLKLRMVGSGGSAAPRATIEKFRELFGAIMLHAWGMTETSPLATVGAPLAKHEGASASELIDMQVKQGRQVYGIELKLVGRDGGDLPNDGVSVGELKVRGNWVISGYFKGEGGEVVDKDGWLGTGDVGTIDPDGYVQLTDRLKDVIKSGGEWISSIEIENLAMSHPDVFEAAVIAVEHPVWQERPLLIVHPREGRKPTKAALSQVPLRKTGEVAAAGRCRVRRRSPAYRDGQAAQDGIAPAIPRASRGKRLRRRARGSRLGRSVDRRQH